MKDKDPPRMLNWVLVSVLLIAFALFAQSAWPGSVAAVTLYKAHLMCLGGWGGYWLDRALFPYDRPHTHLIDDKVDPVSPPGPNGETEACLQVTSSAYTLGMIRRAIVVAACLVCVGLGA